jgi:hypothetical protein
LTAGTGLMRARMVVREAIHTIQQLRHGRIRGGSAA